jgi:hypothetical protein
MDQGERKYFWIKWIGIMVNMSFVTWYCIEYGKECMSTEESTNIVVGSKIGLDTVAMVSGLFLGDALRRIWICYRRQTGLLQNQKTMLLHLIMFTLLVGSIIGKTIAVTGYLDSNKQKDYGKSLAWYTANIWF